jgi:hypothetical protein
VLEEEFLEESNDGAGADADEDVVDSDLGVMFFAAGVVKAGDGAGGEVAENVGVVRLPAAVVALADDDGGDGIEGTGDNMSFAPVEVARVLM